MQDNVPVTPSELVEAPSPFDARAFLANLTERPGVYRMLDAAGDVLYVGKARNLRQRVSSYFRSSGLSIKTQALVVRIADIQTTVTHSETEALLLEQNLIKSLRPPFNILLRDDKSYPYIYLSSHAQYPSLTLRRGRNKRAKGTWFGPYPSAGAVRESLNLLQKLFKVRQCDDVFFSNRSRPCLQYQIERCSAPCVGLISPEEYARDLMHAAQFLEGRNPSILQDLMQAMEAAAVRLDFERAAVYRDQISRLRVIQEQQAIEAEAGDADVLVVRQDAGVVCVILIVVRGGRVLGTKHFFPRFVLEMTAAEQLGGFIGQYYLGGMPLNGWPREILVPEPPEDVDVLAGALSALAGRELPIRHKVRGERRRWLELAATNAEQTLRSHLSSKETIYRRFLSLRDVLDMEQVPQRLECFDISHSQGECTVASCVVFDQNGPLKTDYRLYNIEGVTAGDDYGAMRQVLERRYRKLESGDGKRPDLVLIDGGEGQLNVARTVFEALAITDIPLIGVAKGETRKAGMEVLIDALTGEQFRLPPSSPALHLIQHIRDESHRFAISGHRQRRDKKRRTSTLEGIEGIGPKKRRDLIRYFGGLQGIRNASVDEIAKVKGIGRNLAEALYAALHNE